MIICGSCFHEIPAGLTSCPHCGEDAAPIDPGPAEESREWSIVRTVSTEMEARILAGRLIAYGIPACVLSQVDSTRGFTVGALAIAKVFVPGPRLEEAGSLLSRSGGDLLEGDYTEEGPADGGEESSDPDETERS